MERIRDAVQQRAIDHEDNTPFGILTVSGGVVVPDPAIKRTMQQLVDAADVALYQAKAAGRNRIEVYRPAR